MPLPIVAQASSPTINNESIGSHETVSQGAVVGAIKDVVLPADR